MFIIIAFILFVYIYCMNKKNIIIIAIFTSFILGVLGEVLNNDYNLNMPGLGSIFTIITMGTFIMKQKNK